MHVTKQDDVISCSFVPSTPLLQADRIILSIRSFLSKDYPLKSMVVDANGVASLITPHQLTQYIDYRI